MSCLTATLLLAFYTVSIVNYPGKISVLDWLSSCSDLVESLKVTDGRRHCQVVREFILQVSDQHPELSSPVAHMVQPESREQTICYVREKKLNSQCIGVGSEWRRQKAPVSDCGRT